LHIFAEGISYTSPSSNFLRIEQSLRLQLLLKESLSLAIVDISSMGNVIHKNFVGIFSDLKDNPNFANANSRESNQLTPELLISSSSGG
jgi:hypothetical protein